MLFFLGLAIGLGVAVMWSGKRTAPPAEDWLAHARSQGWRTVSHSEDFSWRCEMITLKRSK